jgi:DNA-binding LytR/AlgR family response regulator
VLISADEIHQIESNGNYVFLHLADGKGILRSTLQAILQNLPKGSFQIDGAIAIDAFS